MQGRILGIDIGATTVKYASVSPDGNLIAKGVEPVASVGNGEFVEQLAAIIARSDFAGIRQVGIGSPGPLDLDSGTIIASANMPGIQNLQLLAELGAKFPDKVIRLENDANAATLGEKIFGAGRAFSDFAVLTLGTGVGGGCVFGGKLQRGYRGNFFEVGHVNVAGIHSDSPRLCGCGNTGCLEAYASATGIARSFELATGTQKTAAQIAALARDNNSAALAAYDLAGRALGFAMAAITQLMNIRHFILTGGVAAAEALLRPSLVSAYRGQTLAVLHSSSEFIFTAGDENAGILGAAALFLGSDAQ